VTEDEKRQMFYDLGYQDGILVASAVWAILMGVVLLAVLG
jgi:hypothetical protein